MRFTRTALLVAGVVAAATFLPTSSATADTSQCSSPSGTCAAKAVFESYGEIFRLYDQSADGHSAVLLYWLADGTGPYWVWNSGGNGTVVTVNLELPEGQWIRYMACTGESGPKTLVANSCGLGDTDFA